MSAAHARKPHLLARYVHVNLDVRDRVQYVLVPPFNFDVSPGSPALRVDGGARKGVRDLLREDWNLAIAGSQGLEPKCHRRMQIDNVALCPLPRANGKPEIEQGHTPTAGQMELPGP